MRFDVRAFCVANKADAPDECQDAFAFDSARGIAVIADGVSTRLFSRPWARILAQGAVQQPPPLHDAEQFKAWLSDRRVDWPKHFDVSRLGFGQREKMRQNPGGASTLLWLELSPVAVAAREQGANGELDENGEQDQNGESGEAAGRYRLQAYSIGDGSLFHFRDGKCIHRLAPETAADFSLDPLVLLSVDLNVDHYLEFKPLDVLCHPGDVLVLCTDAVGLWATKLSEAGMPVDWERQWNMTDEEWLQQILTLRDESSMRVDDTTLLILRVVEETSPLMPTAATETTINVEPGAEAATVDEPFEIESPAAEAEENVAVSNAVAEIDEATEAAQEAELVADDVSALDVPAPMGEENGEAMDRPVSE